MSSKCQNGLRAFPKKHFFVVCEASYYFDIMDHSIGFFLSAKNVLKMADWPKKLYWGIFYFCEIDPVICHKGTGTFQIGPASFFRTFFIDFSFY